MFNIRRISGSPEAGEEMSLKEYSSLNRFLFWSAAVFFLCAAGILSSGCRREASLPDHGPSGQNGGSFSSEGPASVLPALEAYLRSAEKEWGFQGTVIVSRAGAVLFKTAVGWADVSLKKPNTPKTKFLIGSMTKTFTAAAVMKLVDERKIRLDDPAVLFLPGLRNVISSEVKIRHLLSHTSGLPEFDIRAVGGMDMTEPVDPETLAASLSGREPLFQPGRSSRYSNIGYVLLGLIIENISGIPYDDWISSRILEVLEMRDSGIAADYFTRSDFARGYAEDGTGALFPAPIIHPSWGYAAGSLFSTVEDLNRWDRALSRAGFLSGESLEEMFRPQGGSFGFGWILGDVYGTRTAAHGGGTPGYVSWMERWLDKDVFVAVLSNVVGSPVGEIGRSLAAILFGEKYEVPEKRTAVFLNPDILDGYVGKYRLKNGEIRQVVCEGGSLFIRRDGASKLPILSWEEDRFFFPNDKGAWLRFIRDSSGHISGQVFHHLGVNESAVRLER